MAAWVPTIVIVLASVVTVVIVGPTGSHSRGRVVPHATRLGQDPNSEFKEWLLLNGYRFCTIVKAKH